MKLTYDQSSLLTLSAPTDLGNSCPELFRDSHSKGFETWAHPSSEIRRYFDSREGLLLIDQVIRRKEGDSYLFHFPEIQPHLFAALDEWKKSDHRGVMILPDETSKIHLTLLVLAESSWNTLILLPNQLQLEKWKHDLAKYYSGSIGTIHSSIPTFGSITLATYDTASRNLALISNQFELVIVDECQSIEGSAYNSLLKLTHVKYRLGLATTPVKNESRIKDILGTILLEIHQTSSQDKNSLLLKLNLSQEEQCRYESEIKTYKKVLHKFKESFPTRNYKDWIRFALRTPEGRNALLALKRSLYLLSFHQSKSHVLRTLIHQHRNQKTLIFTPDLECTYRISRDYRIFPITPEIGRRERDQLFQAFKEGRIQSLAITQISNHLLDNLHSEVAIRLRNTSQLCEQTRTTKNDLYSNQNKFEVTYDLLFRNNIATRTSSESSQKMLH